MVEIGHGCEVQLEIELPKRPPDPLPARRANRPAAGEVFGCRSRRDDGTQAIDSAAFGIEAEDRRRRRCTQVGDQLSQLTFRLDVAGHQDDSRRLHPAQDPRFLDGEDGSLDAEEEDPPPLT